jgi:hypothetical protein
MQELVTVPKEEYSRLKRQAEIDVKFVKELVESICDIKAGRVRQVR